MREVIIAVVGISTGLFLTAMIVTACGHQYAPLAPPKEYAVVHECKVMTQDGYVDQEICKVTTYSGQQLCELYVHGPIIIPCEFFDGVK